LALQLFSYRNKFRWYVTPYLSILHYFANVLICSTCRHSSTDIFALAPHFVRTARSIRKCSSPNKESRTRNLFESGVKLGHEALYILNRKKQKVSWLGVSLPRASLVSVPVEVWLFFSFFIGLLFCFAIFICSVTVLTCEQLGSVDTAIRKAQEGELFIGEPRTRSAECLVAGDGSSSDISRCKTTKLSATEFKEKQRPNIAPCVEHLASAAILSAGIKLDTSGVTHVALPVEFEGIALVMLSSHNSCEWRILNPKVASLSSPSSLLQKQLCLAQPFSPQSHMALQAILCQI
jgi:hypothetical protein